MHNTADGLPHYVTVPPTLHVLETPVTKTYMHYST